MSPISFASDAARAALLRGLAITGVMIAMLGAVACATAGDGSGIATGPASTSLPGSSAAATGSAIAVTAAPPGSLAMEVGAALGAPADRVELTIRPEIQAIVEEERKRLESDWHPRAATVIVIDPKNGEVVAMTDAATAVIPRVSGSTMKSLTVAAALEEKAIAVSDRFQCAPRSYGGEVLHDASDNGMLDVTQIITRSSNVGASRIFDKLGGAGLERWLRRFHLGEGFAQLRAARAGTVPAATADGSLAGAVIAGGESGAIATPLQMAAAYAALANDGIYNAPTLARRVLGAGGQVLFQAKAGNERLIRAETAQTVRAMLERVVSDDQATGKAARVAGVRTAGKTGTSEETEGEVTTRYASFIGMAPAEQPRFVILVGVVATAEDATGGKVAAPVFARIAARLLAH